MIAARSNLQLTPFDEDNLAKFEHQRCLLKARVNGVAQQKHVGTYITGRPGTGKTHTVKEQLDGNNINYQYINCRVSPGGLYDAMRQNPEDVFVLDDVSTLYTHPQGLQVLQAALNGSASEPRKITYVLKGEQKEKPFDFRGGVIAISNRPLQRDPVADAVVSRVRTLEHEPSNEMIAAFMRHRALNGFADITPEECWEVVDFVIAQSKKCEYRLDLRHMEHGWQDYRLWKHGESLDIHWKELIATSMNQTVKEDELLEPLIARADKLRQQREKVRQAMKLFPGDRTKQIEFVGLPTRTFDRRVNEVKRTR